MLMAGPARLRDLSRIPGSTSRRCWRPCAALWPGWLQRTTGCPRPMPRRMRRATGSICSTRTRSTGSLSSVSSGGRGSARRCTTIASGAWSARCAAPNTGSTIRAAPDGRLQPGETHHLAPGAVVAVSPRIGDIHAIANGFDDRVSISIHAYGGNNGRIRRAIFDPATGAPNPSSPAAPMRNCRTSGQATESPRPGFSAR